MSVGPIRRRRFTERSWVLSRVDSSLLCVSESCRYWESTVPYEDSSQGVDRRGVGHGGGVYQSKQKDFQTKGVQTELVFGNYRRVKEVLFQF